MGARHGLQSMFSPGAVTTGLDDDFPGLPSTVSASPSSTLEAGDLGMTTGDNAGAVAAVGAAEQASASVTTDEDDETRAADSETVSMATSSLSAGMSLVTSHWIMQQPAYTFTRLYQRFPSVLSHR